jgi:hypothetical protein
MPQYRESTHYAVWYLDHSRKFVAKLYETVDGVRTPFDCTAQDTWHLQFYNLPSDTSLRLNQSLTVSTDEEDGVRNMVEGNAELDSGVDATEGTVYVKLVSVTGGVPSIFDAPWEATVYDGGPTS